jgi:hypothetical protein
MNTKGVAPMDDITIAEDGGAVDAEKMRQWQLKKMLAQELLQEVSQALADKLTADDMAQVMRSVATFGLKLSSEDGRSLGRRALAIHAAAPSGSGGGELEGIMTSRFLMLLRALLRLV